MIRLAWPRGNPSRKKATEDQKGYTMSTAAPARRRIAEPHHDPEKPGPADVLVVFGITGDLAKVMTFHSLYRLEARGLLNCPIVGVAAQDWSAKALREHAHEAIENCGRAAGETLDDGVFSRFAAAALVRERRLRRRGHLRAGRRGDRRRAPARSSISRSLRRSSAWSSRVSPKLGLTANARVVVEKPFGHDLASARALAEEIHQYIDESQLYRIDHFLGKMGTDELLYLRFGNTMIEPIWNRNHIACVQITMAESFGVEDRGHFYDPVGALRDVVVNHLMQLLAVAAMEAPCRQRREDTQGREVRAVQRDRGRQARPLRPRSVRRLSRHRRRRQGLHHRDLRRDAPRHRQLALVGSAVVHPHREAASRDADGAARRVP